MRSEENDRPRGLVFSPHSPLLTPHPSRRAGPRFHPALEFRVVGQVGELLQPALRLLGRDALRLGRRRRRRAPAEADGRPAPGNRDSRGRGTGGGGRPPSIGGRRKRRSAARGDDSRRMIASITSSASSAQGEEDVNALMLLFAARRRAAALAASKTTVTRPGSSACRASSRPSRVRRAFSSPCGPTRPSQHAHRVQQVVAVDEVTHGDPPAGGAGHPRFGAAPDRRIL